MTDIEWTTEQYHQWLQEDESRPRKYRNQPCEIDGFNFDSQAEGMQYLYLRGELGFARITDLLMQPKFLLAEPFRRRGVHYRAIHYIADFSYRIPGEPLIIVEDVKGGAATQTQVFRMKRKLFMARYGDTHDLRVVEA